MYRHVFPFAAVVGQEDLKLSLVLNAINPGIGGVLVRGEKGTAKSTTVRALAALLPEIKVVAGCPYGCDPDLPSQMCPACKGKGAALEPARRQTKVVTLPLNATEDRIVGGIDFDMAVRRGVRIFQPGLLARVHRGILYVDEVNLLDDHLVDVILDVAASGENRVEREGVSYRHPSRFILVGTMNPEEGELRPQLLDRFGLCVEVAGEVEAEKRILMMERREAFDADPIKFVNQFQEDTARIAQKIVSARAMLESVAMPRHLRAVVAELCAQNRVAGHRADLVIEQSAKALAAYQGRRQVTVKDIETVAPFALAHRRRDPVPSPPPPTKDHNHDHDHSNQQNRNPEETPDEGHGSEKKQTGESKGPAPDEHAPSGQNDANADPADVSPEDRRREVQERIFAVGATFKVRKITAPKDRTFRRGSGRRSRTRTSQKQGRYVKNDFKRGADIALDATLRAAAPYQRRRQNGNGLAVVVRPEDIRAKIREKRIGNFLLFVVDASGSMGARGRMVASKGAVMSLLLDAYQKRDRIAMISFRKDKAFLNLPPTASIELAARLLAEMPVGGRTPLSAGLVKTYEALRNHLTRDPTSRPIVILITDGKSNAALSARKPMAEALEIAGQMALDARTRFIVVDTENAGLVRFGLARQLAGALNARYFQIDDLKADTLIDIVKGGC